MVVFNIQLQVSNFWSLFEIFGTVEALSRNVTMLFTYSELAAVTKHFLLCDTVTFLFGFTKPQTYFTSFGGSIQLYGS